MNKHHNTVSQGVKTLQRRAFLQRAAQLSMTGVAAPWALNLATIALAAAATTVTDYKALVCVFLYGGNDYANTVVPYDTSNYNVYQTTRIAAASGGIATDRSALLPLTPVASAPLPSGMQFALAPELTGLKTLFDAGKLGVMLNVGPLVQPTTLAQYNAQSVPLPPKLFSHNDQQSIWQSSKAEGSTEGWGGHLGDLMLSNNSNAAFTCMNVSGNAVFMSGASAVQYQVSPTGPVKLNASTSNLYGSAACAAALRTLTQASSSQVLEASHSAIMKRAVEAEAQLSAALAATPPLTTPFNAANSLAAQLQMVARTIAARDNGVGAKRQVFFVSLGGFDLHDFLPTQHPGLLTNVQEALKSFYDATVELGISNQVTTFTASDFGRTLSSNGDGSDHGWGSHHFVLGGAVQGQRFYGTAPVTAVSGPSDVGQGRLLPTTSVDQFAASLATWFGVSSTDMRTALPNIGNFASGTLPIF